MTSMNNGYDGSMMNGESAFHDRGRVSELNRQGLQTVVNWQEYFGHPTGSLLGVFNAIQSIGGIAGLPFAPYANDKFGRRWALFFGNVCEWSSILLSISGLIIQ
jgi:MFS family permease